MTQSEAALSQLNGMGVQVLYAQGLNRPCMADRAGLVLVGRNKGGAKLAACLHHEKWHFLLDEFYGAEAPRRVRARAEAKVNRSCLRQLVPRRALAVLLKQGRRTDEIAEILGTTPETVVQAINLYRGEA